MNNNVISNVFCYLYNEYLISKKYVYYLFSRIKNNLSADNVGNTFCLHFTFLCKKCSN